MAYARKSVKIDKQPQKKAPGKIQAGTKNLRYDHTGVGYGYQIKGKLPKTQNESVKFKTPGFKELWEAVGAL